MAQLLVLMPVQQEQVQEVELHKFKQEEEVVVEMFQILLHSHALIHAGIHVIVFLLHLLVELMHQVQAQVLAQEQLQEAIMHKLLVKEQELDLVQLLVVMHLLLDQGQDQVLQMLEQVEVQPLDKVQVVVVELPMVETRQHQAKEQVQVQDQHKVAMVEAVNIQLHHAVLI